MKHKNSASNRRSCQTTTGWETHMYLSREVHSYSASIYCCSITFTAAQLHRQSGVTDVTARELVLEINNHLLFNVTEVQNLLSSSALATLVHFSATRFLLFGNVHARFLFSPCTRSQCSYIVTCCSERRVVWRVFTFHSLTSRLRRLALRGPAGGRAKGQAEWNRNEPKTGSGIDDVLVRIRCVGMKWVSSYRSHRWPLCFF